MEKSGQLILSWGFAWTRASKIKKSNPTAEVCHLVARDSRDVDF